MESLKNVLQAVSSVRDLADAAVAADVPAVPAAAAHPAAAAAAQWRWLQQGLQVQLLQCPAPASIDVLAAGRSLVTAPAAVVVSLAAWCWHVAAGLVLQLPYALMPPCHNRRQIPVAHGLHCHGCAADYAAVSVDLLPEALAAADCVEACCSLALWTQQEAVQQLSLPSELLLAMLILQQHHWIFFWLTAAELLKC